MRLWIATGATFLASLYFGYLCILTGTAENCDNGIERASCSDFVRAIAFPGFCICVIAALVLLFLAAYGRKR